MSRQLKMYARAVLALAIVAGPISALTTPAAASHESTTIRVGVSNEGDTSRDNYDDSDLARPVGATFTFSFDYRDHNVRWTTANPGALAASPGATAPIGSTYAVTTNVAGTYIYYCSLHSTASDALSATDFSDPRPAKMYGRLVITADTTAPVWSNTNPATATANSATQITVAWPAATDNSGSVFYDVFQSTTNVQPATPVSNNQTALTYVATGLTSGQMYYFWIVPVDLANNAAAARTASAVAAAGPSLSITVMPAILDLGTLSPAAAGVGTATVTVGSNSTWSLTVKSIGRNGVDDATGDDAVFTDNGVKTIPVGRATWNAGGGALPLSDVSTVARTAQPAAASTVVNFAFSLTPLFTDQAGTNYRTTVLYTVTQP